MGLAESFLWNIQDRWQVDTTKEEAPNGTDDSQEDGASSSYKTG
jgi:hypothetical protein